MPTKTKAQTTDSTTSVAGSEPKPKRQRSSKSTTPDLTPVPEPETIKAEPESVPEANPESDSIASQSASDPIPALSVEVGQEALTIALAALEKVVPAKPSHPILGSILIEAVPEDPSPLTLTATNLMRSVTASLNLPAGARVQAGTIATPAKTLKEVVTHAAGGTLTLNQHWQASGSTLTVLDQEQGATTLSSDSAKDFPQLSTATPQHTLPAKVVLLALRTAAVASAAKEEKGVIYGVHWQFDPSAETLNCTATDSHRVAQVEAAIGGVGRKRRSTETEPVIDCRLRADFVRDLCQVLTTLEPESTIDFGYDSDSYQVVFEIQVNQWVRLSLSSRCHEATFPDVSKLIGRFVYDKEVVVDRAALQARLERLEATTAPSETPVIDIDCQTGAVTLSKESQSVQSQQVTTATVAEAAQGFKLACNLVYLSNFVKACQSQQIKLTMGGSTTLIRVEAAGETAMITTDLTTVYYLMPMQRRES
jgi:DNA polymerase III subunit beta